jgi:hypothetical protein
MKRLRSLLPALMLLAVSAHAGQIGIADFVNPNIDTLTNIGITPFPFQHTTPITRPTFVATPVTGWLIYYYNDCGGVQACIDNGSIGSNGSGTTTDITFDQPYTNVGMLIGRATTGREFYDADDNLIGVYDQTDFFGDHFMAWEDAGGISRVRLTGYSNFDNVYVEGLVSSGVPEPASMILVASAALGAAFIRRRGRA